MQPITQEQQKRLEGFTEQRDKIVKEINELVPRHDSLTKANNELNTANSILTSEIAENEQKVIHSARVTAETIGKHNEEKISSTKELEALLDKKKSLQDEVTNTIADLAAIKEAVKGVLEMVNAIPEELRVIRKEAKDSIDSINNGAAEVARVTAGISNIVGEFHNKYISKEIDVEIRRQKLDNRETALNDREVAVNSTYGEIIKHMEKGSVKLSDLNKDRSL